MDWHPKTISGLKVWAIIALLLPGAACHKNEVNPRLNEQMPPKMIWAWERPEDLQFIDTAKYGVAFLAQSIYLEQDKIVPKPRRQPLDVSPGTYLVAVTRIETNKAGPKRPTFDKNMATRTAALIRSTLDLPDVKGIQIDFDAVTSERAFYRLLMNTLKSQLPAETPLTMTSLASWCTGDAWFNDFPVDEAVPMAFQMGADEEKIKTFLRNGSDWNEPLCRGSYGLSVDDPLDLTIRPGRRIYYFKSSSWKTADLEQMK